MIEFDILSHLAQPNVSGFMLSALQIRSERKSEDRGQHAGSGETVKGQFRAGGKVQRVEV